MTFEDAPNRDRLLDLVAESNVDPMMALIMCAKWMGDDAVGEMLDANELSERFLEEQS